MTFDWVSFGFQLVNVIVLLAILQRFLFKPVAAMIARRRDETDAALKAAQAAKTEAEAAASRADAQAEASRTGRQEILSKAREDAEAQRNTLIQQAHTEAAKIVAEGQAARERDDRRAEEKLVERARDLASAIAKRALEAQPATFKGYVDRLADTLSALPVAERNALLRGGGLTIVSATVLSPEERQTVLATLEPFHVQVETTEDPALISGLELRSQSGVLRNSLLHDLERITEAMHDEY